MNSQMTGNQIEEWIVNLEQAQELMLEAWQLVSGYCQESGDRNTQAYIADHLRILIDEDHGFLSRDRNLGDVIRALRTGEMDDLVHNKNDEFEDDGHGRYIIVPHDQIVFDDDQEKEGPVYYNPDGEIIFE
jgi:hypothetical protein